MKIRTVELTPDQFGELEKGRSKGKSDAFRKRCHLVLLKNTKRTSAEVGQILGMHQNSVNNWLDRYESEGIDGLRTKPGRGRKPLLNVGQDGEALRKVVSEERRRLRLAKAELEKMLGKTFCQRTLTRFL